MSPEPPAPDISVIIAVHNDGPGLADTLGALDAQDLDPGRFEVVVVDDGSTDDTAQVAARYAAVTLVRRAGSGGSYVARNEALKRARGRFIAVTDADCKPAPEWLRTAIARLDAEPTKVFAGRIVMPLGPRPTVAAMVDVMRHLDQEKYVREYGTAATANLFASADTFRSVGGFDERLRSSGDADWTRRAGQAGHEVVYAPDAVVMHPPRASAAAMLRKARRVGEGARAAARAGLTSGRPLYLTPWCIVPYGRRRGLDRLRDNGYDPGPLMTACLPIAQIALVQLPQALYGLRFDLRAVRAGRSGARTGSPTVGG